MGIDGIEFHPGYHNRKSIFFKLQGVEVSPSNEHYSLWECVVQVGSVEKSF